MSALIQKQTLGTVVRISARRLLGPDPIIAWVFLAAEDDRFSVEPGHTLDPGYPLRITMLHIDTERASEGDYRGSSAPSPLHYAGRVPLWALKSAA